MASPAPPVPSPKSHTIDRLFPSSMSDGFELSRTRSGAGPLEGSASALTVGDWLPGGSGIVYVIVLVTLPPRTSVALTVTVFVPEVRNVCSTSRPNCLPPSPKSHS